MAPSSRDPRTADRRKTITISSGAALTLGFALSPALEAATFTVTNLNDSGAGSLRDALVSANTAPGSDIIDFQSGLSGTIGLTSGELYIYDPVEIQGPGSDQLTVSGSDSSRLFYIYAPTGGEITISGLTLTEGLADGDSGPPFGGAILAIGDGSLILENVVVSNSVAGVGGGIFSISSLTLRDSEVAGNSALYSGSGFLYGIGGGITHGLPFYVGYSAGNLNIERTTVSGNSAAIGGGAVIFSLGGSLSTNITESTIAENTALGPVGGVGVIGGSLTISGSTIRDNTSGGYLYAGGGGGLFAAATYEPAEIVNTTISGNVAETGGGIVFYEGELNLRHSTVAANEATSAGGGIALGDGVVLIENSIVADNIAPDSPDLYGSYLYPGTFYLDHSLVEDPDSANIVVGSGVILNQDPVLGPLTDNGGPTLTHLPLMGSPAINAGDPAFTPPPETDQRGLPRVEQGRLDMGAVETEAAAGVAVQIPTLGFFGKVAMILAAAWAGLVAMNRRLFTILLLSALASMIGVDSYATAAPEKGRWYDRLMDARPNSSSNSEYSTIERATVEGDDLVLDLSEVTDLRIELHRVMIIDHRGGTAAKRGHRTSAAKREHRQKGLMAKFIPAKSLPTAIDAGQPALIREPEGNQGMTVIHLYDTEAAARKALALTR